MSEAANAGVTYRRIEAAAFDSRDCATRSCTREAESGSDYCRECLEQNAVPLPAVWGRS